MPDCVIALVLYPVSNNEAVSSVGRPCGICLWSLLVKFKLHHQRITSSEVWVLPLLKRRLASSRAGARRVCRQCPAGTQGAAAVQRQWQTSVTALCNWPPDCFSGYGIAVEWRRKWSAQMTFVTTEIWRRRRRRDIPQVNGCDFINNTN